MRPFFTSIASSRRSRCARQSRATMTSEALMTAYTSSPLLSRRSSTASLDGGGDHGAAGDPDTDMGRGRALLHLEDLPLENVARAQLHAVLLDASAISPSIASRILTRHRRYRVAIRAQQDQASRTDRRAEPETFNRHVST